MLKNLITCRFETSFVSLRSFVALTTRLFVLADTDTLKKPSANKKSDSYHRRKQNLLNTDLDTAQLMLAYD